MGEFSAVLEAWTTGITDSRHAPCTPEWRAFARAARTFRRSTSPRRIRCPTSTPEASPTRSSRPVTTSVRVAAPVYQRLWQPGVARFEDALAELEATEGAVAFASGMAALAACLIASVTAGRPHVVAVRPLYGGTDHVLENGLLGTTVTWATVDEIAAAIRPTRDS